MSEDSSKTPILPGTPHSWGPVVGIVYGFGVALLSVQIGVGLLMGLLLGLLGMSTYDIGQWTNTIHGQFIFTGAAEIMMFGAIVFYLHRKRITLEKIGLGGFQKKYLLYVLIGTLVYFLAYFIAVSVIAVLVPSLNLQQEQDLGFNNPVGLVQMSMVFVSLVILPPIAEETVFRGFIFTGIRTKSSFLISAIITSILFALGHLQIGQGSPLLWVAGIDTFVLSFVLCYIREKTGSIWPTIGIHMVKNFVAFTFLYLIR